LTVGNEAVGNEAVGNEAVGNEAVGNEAVGNEAVGSIAIVVAEFNMEVTSRMLEVARERSRMLNLNIVKISKVPGTFDMPVIVDALLRRDDVDGVVTLGAVIKGQTKHDEIISHSTARVLADLAVKYEKPVSLGITGPGMQERHAFARIRPVAERAVEAVIKTGNELLKVRK